MFIFNKIFIIAKSKFIKSLKEITMNNKDKLLLNYIEF